MPHPLILLDRSRLGAAVVCGVGALVLSACVTPEEINPPTAAFVVASGKIVTSMQTDMLSGYRKNLRQDMLMADVLEFVETRQPVSRTPVRWLCAANYQYQKISLPVAEMDGRNKILTDRTAAPANDLGALIQALGTSYSIPPEKEAVTVSYNEWLDGGGGKKCGDLIADADPYAIRPQARQEIALAGIAAGVSLVEALWAVIKPVAISALQNIDTERRAAALKAYFADQKNIDVVKTQLEAIEAFLQSEFDLQQKRTAGAAASAFMVLYDPTAQHWHDAVVLAQGASCAKGRIDGPASPSRKACLDGILKALNKPLMDALAAADAFDIAFAKQLPDDEQRLSKQLVALHQVAIGQAPPEDKLKALWAATLRYVALFQTVSDAASDANQKKISDAWDAFQKALASK